MAKIKRSKNRRDLGESDLKYLRFIDELRKNAQLDSPTAEVARLYKEVIDILTEAFDAYEPSDLPAYQERLNYLIDVSKDQSSLSDPLFQEDLQRAKQLLDSKIKERWGFFQKLRQLGSTTARSIGGITAIGQEAVAAYDAAYNVGMRFGSSGGFGRSKIDAEEKRRIYDVMRGNSGQYGTQQSPAIAQNKPLQSNRSSIVPVNDDRLITTNTTQNKVLNSLLVVTKDSNSELKDIKKLLLAQNREADDRSDGQTLQRLEDQQENKGDVTLSNRQNPFRDLFSPSAPQGDGGPENSSGGVISDLVEYSRDKWLYGLGAAGLGKAGSLAKAGWNKIKNRGKGLKNVLKNNQRPTLTLIEGGKSLTKQAVTKEAEHLAEKSIVKQGSKMGGKLLSKKVPILGSLFGLGYGLERFKNDDWTGGALEITSGVMGSVPGAGTAGSVAIDAILASRDLANQNANSKVNNVTDAQTSDQKKTSSVLNTSATRSLSATIGQKRQGMDYYKDTLKTNLDDKARGEVEQWALDFLYDDAQAKRNKLFKSFSDGSKHGDGSYRINGRSATHEEAKKDVKNAVDMYNRYNEYLVEKKKQGGMTATAVFTNSEGKQYKNPLYNDQEYPTSQHSESSLRSDDVWSGSTGRQTRSQNNLINETSAGPSSLRRRGENTSVETQLRQDILGDKSAPSNATQSMMRGIAAAETGSVTDSRPIDDPSRFIRTKAGANSSAYGPQQITYSLAQNALNKGLLDGDDELKQWTQDNFIPQGKKFLKSDYSDKKYGAGGQGDLNTPKDRDMYQKLSERLIEHTIKANNGNVDAALGEWRFGRGKKNQLSRLDPGYAKKARTQMNRDNVLLAKNDVEMNPRSRDAMQDAVGSLSRKNEVARNQPIVVTQNIPAPQVQGGSTSVSGKTAGAPSNGVSESSFLVALRQNMSNLT